LIQWDKWDPESIWVRDQCIDKLGGVDWEGKVVVDIGSHQGALALTAAVGGAESVLAVEANPVEYENLCKNIMINNQTEVIEAVNIAVTDGLEPLRVSNIGPGQTSCFYTAGHREIMCQSISLQDLIEGYVAKDLVDFLKVDVEGAEFKIFDPTSDWQVQFLSELESFMFDFHGFDQTTLKQFKRLTDKDINKGFASVETARNEMKQMFNDAGFVFDDIERDSGVVWTR